MAKSDESLTAQEATMRTRPCSATPHRVLRTLAATLPLAALLGAAPGRAAPNVYYRAGAWHAFTDKDDQGAAVCGIATENQADGRNLTLTYTIGGSDLTFTAAKPSWNIPDGTILEADMQIDRNEPWQAQGEGHGTTVGWVVSASEIRNFDTQFRNGTTLTLTFPSGNEPPWSLSLRGSTAASATLWRCVQDLTDRAKRATPASNAPASNAPASNAPATQPAGQAPTQPFAPPSGQNAAPANGAAAPAPADGTAPQPTPAPANGAAAPTPSNGAPAPASGTPAQTPSPAGGTPAPATKP
jgi:hypothetical protein